MASPEPDVEAAQPKNEDVEAPADSRPTTSSSVSSSSSSRGSRSTSALSRKSQNESSSRPGTAKSGLSRAGSGRSGKSVTWSTVDSEQGLIPEEDEAEGSGKKKKKKNCCLNIVSGMWASREMLKDDSDKQLYVKTTLRELFIYCIFMFVINYAQFVQYSPIFYVYTSMVKNLFVKQLDVTNMALFWRFVEGDLLDGIYWETWYNRGYKNAEIKCPDGILATGPCQVPPADRNVMYENRLLGLPRIRQLKMSNKSCEIHPDFKNAIKVCYASYDSGNEDTLSYPPTFRNYSSEWAWKYQSEDDLEGTSHWGQLATYSGAGYVQNLHYLKDTSAAVLSELKSSLWVTQGTRFVSIDFTVYNANINLFCVVQLTFEFPATGGVIPDQSVTTVRLLKYSDNADYFLLSCEVVFVLFIAYYVVEETLEIMTHKHRYFLNFWNLLDIVVIGISVAQIFYNIWLTIRSGPILEELLAKPFMYADFGQLASDTRTLAVLSALNVFVAWIKFFKYLSFNKTMTQLSKTLGSAAKDLSGFSVMFGIIYFAFCQLGYLLFGTQVNDFRSFTDSVFTLFRMILGDFNFRDIERANEFLGPVFFLTYIFFVYFVLLNMFLAIINDTYGDVKAELKMQIPEFQMGDFFKTGVNNVKGQLGIHDRGLDVENAIRLAAEDDGFVTYDELRENLRKARFHDTEIDLFFHHFQNDPAISQIILDEEEIKARQLEKERRRMSEFSDSDSDAGFASDDSEDNRPKSGKEARRLRSARIRSAHDDGAPIDDEQFYDVVGRVDKIEQSIAPIANKLDQVLYRLSQVSGGNDKSKKSKKLSKADMEKMFDNILNSDGDTKSVCNQLENLGHMMDDSRPDTGASLKLI